MFAKGLQVAWTILKFILWLAVPVYVFLAFFGIACFCWLMYFRKSQ